MPVIEEIQKPATLCYLSKRIQCRERQAQASKTSFPSNAMLAFGSRISVHDVVGSHKHVGHGPALLSLIKTIGFVR
jgi:hypothetical protein